MEFRTLHVGGPLRLWEKCCLQSFADFGHQITVYGYEPMDVPEGVLFAPAQDVLSEVERDRFFDEAPAAYSRFSDLFRYVLLERHGGWWVDTDVLCLSRDVPKEDIVLGWEDENLICGAIMRLPPAHPLLARAIEFCWQNLHVNERSHLGPHLLTKLVPEFGLSGAVSAPSRLYPVHWSAAFDLIDPRSGAMVENVIGGAPFVHLWQGRIRGGGFQTDLMPPAGSFLAAAFARHGGAGVAALEGAAVVRQIDIVRERNSLLSERARLNREREALKGAQPTG